MKMLAAAISSFGARLLSTAVFVGVSALALFAAPLLESWGNGIAMAVLVVLTAVIGMPHGALDLVTAERLFLPRLGRRWPLYFSAVYLAVALVIAGTWIMFPAPSLYLFLCLSVLHFGVSDSEGGGAPIPRRFPEIIIRGAIPIVFAAKFHYDEVALVFGFLSGDAAAQTAASAAAGLFMPLLVAAVFFIAVHLAMGFRKKAQAPLLFPVELSVTALVFYALPPLWAFTVYWIFLHSLRVLLLAAAREDGAPVKALRRLYTYALPASSAVLVGGALAYPFVRGGGDTLPVVASILFVSLAAVNFPHMFFMAATEGYRRCMAARDDDQSCTSSV